ncbi:restriction endonuclease subunit S [Enterococcus sp. RIT-PI-f]|nr:restriction endonuclease subunit S [Enterococcus sp. RIT-PI-f]KPG70623.1 restriction endonuclease subunit S [Enterococcus sp. RIT-PI-f]
MGEKKAPKLRFDGFDQDWEQRKLSEMYDIMSGFAFKLSDYVEFGISIVNGESINNGNVSSVNWNYLPEHFRKKYSNFILHTDDIVLGLNRPITNGELKIAQIPSYLNGSLLYQRAGKIKIVNNTDINFSYQLLNKEIYKFVLKEAQGSDQPFISTTKLKKWKYTVPREDIEQKKIGTFFKEFDDTIALHQRKLEQIKLLKQTFLQKMFVNHGFVPELRFADFGEEWKQRKLGKVIDIQSGRDYKHLNIGNIPVYGTGGYMLSVDKALSYEEDAVGIGRKGTIDRPYILRSPFWTVDTLFYAIPRVKYDIEFIYSIFQKINWKAKDESTGVPSLSKSVINSISVYLPSSNEQQKIGSFLKQLDNTIALHQKKLDNLKQLKKSLLQKMFI